MRPLFLFIFIFLLWSCESKHNHINNDLVLADSLVSEYKTEEARQQLLHLNKKKLSDNDKAYYDVLEAEINYKEDKPVDQTTAKSSLNYFKKNGTDELYIRALLCNAFALEGINRQDSAAFYAKKAEQISNSKDLNQQLLRCYYFLIGLNSLSGNYHLAIAYDRKLLALAKKENNKKAIGYAYDNMAAVYNSMGDRDSFLYYISMEIPYIKYQDRKEQAYSYNNVAAYYYYKNKDWEKQEYYLQKALKAYPFPIVYRNLANLYVNQGKLKEAEILWDKVLTTNNNYEEKISSLSAYAEWLQKNGRYKEYGEVNHQIIKMKDSLARSQQAERIKELQDEFDRKAEAQTWQQYLWISLCGAAAVIIGILLLHYFKRKKLRKEIARLGSLTKANEEKVKMYEEQIEDMKKKHGTSQREMKKLQKKVDTLRNRQDEMLALGKKHFENIMDGGNTVTWHKDDFVSFVEYYGISHPDFIMSLHRDYDNLSATQKTFLVLLDTGMTLDDVATAMSLSPANLRMTRSRISKKKNA